MTVLRRHKVSRNARPVEAVPSDRLPGVFPKGRRCTKCGHTLSSYNAGPACFRHPKAPRLIRFGNSLEHQDSVDDFQELMEDAA